MPVRVLTNVMLNKTRMLQPMTHGRRSHCPHAGFCTASLPCPAAECSLSGFLDDLLELAKEYGIRRCQAASRRDRKRIALVVGRACADAERRVRRVNGDDSDPPLGCDGRRDWLEGQIVHHATGLACDPLPEEDNLHPRSKSDPLEIIEEGPREAKARFTAMIIAVLNSRKERDDERPEDGKDFIGKKTGGAFGNLDLDTHKLAAELGSSVLEVGQQGVLLG